MFRATVALAALSCAAAFVAGPSAASRASAVRMALSDYVGASTEVGGKPWDPLNLAVISEQSANNPGIQWLRESEIKHCRIAMLAIVGVLVPQYYHLPNYPEVDVFDAIPKVFQTNPFGVLQIVASIAVIEGQTYPEEMWTNQGTRAPGDFGFDPLNFYYGKSDSVKKDLELKELKNGRLAMWAIAAQAAEHLIPGSVPHL